MALNELALNLFFLIDQMILKSRHTILEIQSTLTYFKPGQVPPIELKVMKTASGTETK
ncbi:hypothetical protein WDW37_10260 [Bdellovibrionota bacterium FG-1]